MIEHGAFALAVPFVGIRLTGDHALLNSSVAKRKNSEVDATIEVLNAQEAKNVGAIDWRHINANIPADTIVQSVMPSTRLRHALSVS